MGVQRLISLFVTIKHQLNIVSILSKRFPVKPRLVHILDYLFNNIGVKNFHDTKNILHHFTRVHWGLEKYYYFEASHIKNKTTRIIKIPKTELNNIYTENDTSLSDLLRSQEFHKILRGYIHSAVIWPQRWEIKMTGIDQYVDYLLSTQTDRCKKLIHEW